MSKLYDNHTELNNGFFLNGMTPLDDRLEWNSFEDLYIDYTNKEACRLYGCAYEGMQISMMNDSSIPRVMVLKNPFPYSPDNKAGNDPVNVNAANLGDYWYELEKQLQADVVRIDKNIDAIEADIAVLDSSVNKIEKYVAANNIKSTNKSIDIKTSKNGVGTAYDIDVNLDGDTIKNIGGELTGCKFKLKKVSSNQANINASYRLQILTPGATSYVDVTGSDTIDVYKDYLIKTVHICKATYKNDVYTEVVVQGEVTNDEWKEAEGEVYIHIVWETAQTNDSDENAPADTWINVGDMIDLDLDAIESDIADLQSNLASFKTQTANNFSAVNTTINEVSTRLKNKVDELNETIVDNTSALNASINKINTNLTKKINDSVAALNTSINTVQSDLEALVLDASTELNEAISSLSSTHAADKKNINSSIDALQSKDSAIDSEISAIKDALGLSEDTSTTDGAVIYRVGVLESRADGFDRSIDALEAADETIKNSIKTLEEQVEKDIASDVSTINASIKNINSSISALKTKDSAIDKSIETINTNISALQTKDTAIETDITAINKEIAAIDSSLDDFALKSHLEEVELDVNEALSEMNTRLNAAESSLEKHIADWEEQELVRAQALLDLDARLKKIGG